MKKKHGPATSILAFDLRFVMLDEIILQEYLLKC